MRRAKGTLMNNGPCDVIFTQYLRPDGRRRTVWVERSAETAADARLVVAAGFHFDIEELSSGHVSMTVEPNTTDAHGDDSPVAHELCVNGPSVPDAVDRLVRAAAAHVAARG